MSFDLTLGNVSSTSMLDFDPRCLIVVTPQGTPSPPEVTSTVARPLLHLIKKNRTGFTSIQEKLKIVEVSEEDDDNAEESYVQSTGKKSKLHPPSRNLANQSNATTFEDRSSLGILPVETLANLTMGNNSTMYQDNQFSNLLPSQSKLPSPPASDVAERQAALEFSRLRLSNSPHPVGEAKLTSLDLNHPRKGEEEKIAQSDPIKRSDCDVREKKATDQNSGDAVENGGSNDVVADHPSNFAFVNNSAETVIQRKSGSSISQNNPFQQSDESSVGCALPFKYLLPTPHIGSNTHLNPVEGLSYFLDSTSDSVVGEAEGSTRQEFPSGVQPLTPYWQPKSVNQATFQVFNTPPDVRVQNEVNTTRDERFSDFSNPPSTSQLVSDSNEEDVPENLLPVDELFASLPPQDFTLSDNVEFVSMTNDHFKNFMDEEEKENANEFRFLQEEEDMPNGSANSLHSLGFQTSSESKMNSESPAGSRETGSMSDYFRAGTSRIGLSLDHSSSNGSGFQRLRPDFGFGIGSVRSPQKQPIAVVSAMSVASTSSRSLVESSESSNFTPAEAREHQVHFGGDLGKQTLKQSHVLVASKTGNQNASESQIDQEYLVSFLEHTVCQTITQSGIHDADQVSFDMIAKIIKKATPGLNAREYATRVLAAIRSKGLLRDESTLSATANATVNATSISFLMPSFVEDTIVVQGNKCDGKENSVAASFSLLEASRNSTTSRQRSLVFRHSSPKKLDERATRPTSMAVDVAKSRLQMSQMSNLPEKSVNQINIPRAEILPQVKITPKVLPKQFPIDCNCSSLLWLGCVSEEEKTFLLKNNSDLHQTIILSIKDSPHFSFSNRSKIVSTELNLKPREIKKAGITLAWPGTVGWLSGKIDLKPKLKPTSGKTVCKATIYLQAYCGRPGLVFQSPNLKSGSNNRKILSWNPDMKTARIEIANIGQASGFVVFTNVPTGLTVTPSAIVLQPGQNVTIQLSINGDSWSGHLVALHGSEVDRLLFKSSQGKFSDHKQVLQNFINETRDVLIGCNMRLVPPIDVRQFYDGLDRLEFEVASVNHANLSTSNEHMFYQLPVEETFVSNSTSSTPISKGSEKRSPEFQSGEIEMVIRGNGKALINRGADFSLVEARLQRTQTVQDVSSKRHGQVYLAESRIEVSASSLQSSAFVKVTILNRTSSIQTFSICGLSAPFHSRQRTVSVKPNFYLSFPVVFTPREIDECEVDLCLQNIDNEMKLTCKIIGKVDC